MATTEYRRQFLKQAGALAGAGLVGLVPAVGHAAGSVTESPSPLPGAPIRLSLNESPFGPAPGVLKALTAELQHVSRYGDEDAAKALTAQIANYEQVKPGSIVLGEVLEPLGLYLGTAGGPGGEFIYSTPGYLALVDATSHVGGVSIAVPLDATQSNDLPAIASRVNANTRAVYLVNPHNPSGTVSDDAAFKAFLREVSKKTLVIVDEAYLEYTDDFATRTAAPLVREGANVAVFRTYAKIRGLAGLPFGYLMAPEAVAAALRKAGAGSAESVGRLALTAAAASLRDLASVERVRGVVATERKKWLSLLQELKLSHSAAAASFIFLDSGKPHDVLGGYFLAHGVNVGRAFPPDDTWVRITVGTPAENARVQGLLREWVAAN